MHGWMDRWMHTGIKTEARERKKDRERKRERDVCMYSSNAYMCNSSFGGAAQSLQWTRFNLYFQEKTFH